MPRAVFLDRDGVINRAVVREGKPYPPATLAEFEILPGVLDALRAAGQVEALVREVGEQVGSYLISLAPKLRLGPCLLLPDLLQ